MENGRKIGAMLAALATFLLAASLLAPISANHLPQQPKKLIQQNDEGLWSRDFNDCG